MPHGIGGITTRRRSSAPSSSSRAAKRSNSAIDPKRRGRLSASSSPFSRRDTHASGATVSDSSFHTPSARITPRRPHWPLRSPAMCTMITGTRKRGMHSRCSSFDASAHFHRSAWHCWNDGKKAPYGKCEKSHSGASRSSARLAVALPGTRSGATLACRKRSILHK